MEARHASAEASARRQQQQKVRGVFIRIRLA